MNNRVHYLRCADYGTALPETLGRLLNLAGWLDNPSLDGKRVLVKPNLLTDRTPGQAVTTHPELVRHVIRWLKAAGANVTVGDSPASTANLANVWRTTGIAAVCADENVPLLSFEQAGSQTLERGGFTFALARPVLDADLIVNLPKVKSHSLTLLTAAVKNMYGAVPGYAKTRLHREHPKPAVFGRLLHAMWQAFPPVWNIADAVTGMHGQGPANGTPVQLGFLAAAADPFALDRALCATLGINPCRVPYLNIPGVIDAPPPVTDGDAVTVEAFDIPSGAHLLSLLPDGLIRRLGRLVWVRPAFHAAACVRCGLCVKACPVSALTIGAAAVPALDAPRCISCSCCHEVCPKDAIRMTQPRLLRIIKAFKGLD